MFESIVPAEMGPVNPVPGDPGAGLVRAVILELADMDQDVSEGVRIDRITALEELKAAAAAAQARETEAFVASRRETRAAAGVAAEKRGRGLAKEIGLARQDSPNRGGKHLGLATTLIREMPHTYAALAEGRLNEWRATILVRETACLSVEDRARIDKELCADPKTLRGCGDKRIGAMAKQAALRLDPHSVVRRAAKAETERHVSCRPAPDTMAQVSCLVPVVQGVAVLAALVKEADRLKAQGDERGRGQLMADILVERVTGQPAENPAKIEVQLVMTDRTLFQGDSEPAHLAGYGIVPAQWARDLLRTDNTNNGDGSGDNDASVVGNPIHGAVGEDEVVAGAADAGNGDGATGSGPPGTVEPVPVTDAGSDTGNTETGTATGPPGSERRASGDSEDVEVWVRRLYTAPGTGQLLGMDSRARLMPAGMQRMLQARDQLCRTPWCDAPIRHHDHVVPWRDAGATSEVNGQGLCEACNLAKESEGWHAQRIPGPRHTVETTTPTGHTYQSTAPPLPGTPSEINAGEKRRPTLNPQLEGLPPEVESMPVPQEAPLLEAVEELAAEEPRPTPVRYPAITGRIDFIYYRAA
ncbi:HNH endonuclease [Arthrobacter sp. VKM Ac-2550]|uniref:HNH endonuclease n=1 Tax=Crystallibacter permensis TaxID=1938888 RepID=UPI002226BF9C|nr:HNH endonuclease signature motif containing protein [Arthrobacter sp. VKM Ac-2550]MCW2133316.1 HNH endonuclease [Arthrobacter sp. VKM Ac-2550]